MSSSDSREQLFATVLLQQVALCDARMLPKHVCKVRVALLLEFGHRLTLHIGTLARPNLMP